MHPDHGQGHRRTIAGKYEADAATRREGLIDPQAEIFAKELNRPLEELVSEYKEAQIHGQGVRYVADSSVTSSGSSNPQEFNGA